MLTCGGSKATFLRHRKAIRWSLARKARFARPGRGKSGGGRVIYYVSFGRSLLAKLTAYAKNVQGDLTAEDRRAILLAVESILSDKQ
jgi:hypothetical protein